MFSVQQPAGNNVHKLHADLKKDDDLPLDGDALLKGTIVQLAIDWSDFVPKEFRHGKPGYIS